MTLEALIAKIGELILKRKATHDRAEQERINAKLTKLYDLKRIMLSQRG